MQVTKFTTSIYFIVISSKRTSNVLIRETAKFIFGMHFPAGSMGSFTIVGI